MAELENWIEATGLAQVNTHSDIEIGMRRIFDAGFPGADKSKSKQGRQITELFNMSGSDPGKLAAAVDKALGTPGAGINYVKSVLSGKNGNNGNGNGHEPQRQARPRPATPPPEPKAPVEQAVTIAKRVNPGWVKLYRSAEDHWTYTDKRHWPFKIWVHLLLHAEWQDRIIYRYGQKIVIRRGEVDVTERQLADLVGVAPCSMHRFLRQLIAEGEIEIRHIARKKGDKSEARMLAGMLAGMLAPSEAPKQSILVVGFTVVNVLKYNFYQRSEEENQSVPACINEAQSEAGMLAGMLAGTEALPKKEELKNKNTTPLPPFDPPTPEQILDIYESKRGKMKSLGTYSRSPANIKLAGQLIEDLAQTFGSEAVVLEHWTEVVVYAATQCHESFFRFIKFNWIAKSTGNCQDIIEGKYNQPFTKGESQHGTARAQSRGSAENDPKDAKFLKSMRIKANKTV